MSSYTRKKEAKDRARVMQMTRLNLPLLAVKMEDGDRKSKSTGGL